MKYRTRLFLASLLLSLLLQISRHQHSYGIAFCVDVIWGAIVLPFAWQVKLINSFAFGLDPDADFWRYGGLLLLVSLTVWLFPIARVERWFGTFDAFRQEKLRLPSLWRGAAALLDTLHRLKVGKGKMGGWA